MALMGRRRPLSVTPDQVVFRDVTAGESRSVPIVVRNTTGHPTRIRFLLPHNSVFSVPANTNLMTAPGLQCRTSVSYCATSSDPASDVLRVEYDCGCVEVPISAFGPTAALVVHPTEIDLQQLSVNTV
jgi:hypothetical protein